MEEKNNGCRIFWKILFKGKNVGKGEAIKKVDIGTDLKKKRNFKMMLLKEETRYLEIIR